MDGQTPRPGYTKTGKSLKQVRRYYAMQEAARKKRRSPEADEDERSGSQNPKRKRSPDDDKLSKRIFQELKVQQEAIEKRSRRYPSPPEPTPAPAPNPVLEMRDGGPVFVTKNEAVFAIKSLKSNKSNKSVTPVLGYTSQTQGSNNFGPTSLGCIFSCFNLALVYVAAWIYMIISKPEKKATEGTNPGYGDFGALRWLALTSTLVLIAVPYWMIASHELMHAIVTLIMLMLSLISVATYILYHNIVSNHTEHTPPNFYLSEAPNPLNFWFPVTFLLLHIISVFFMIKQVSVLSRIKPEPSRGDSKGEQTPMSVFLAPK